MSEAQTIHVVLAVFNPNVLHLERQLGSLAQQERVQIYLHAVIADLSSGDLVLHFAQMFGLSCDIHVPARKLSAVEAFEFGLDEALHASESGDLFALCDQDDVWHREKLLNSLAALQQTKGCHLVHTDARLVDKDGALLAKSMFAHERRDWRTGLRRLLYRNSITGMTALFTRDVVSHALPFPRQAGTFFYHDLWLGLIAAAKGPVVCLREPMVDYRQHGGNVVGAVNQRDGLRVFSKPWLRSRFASFSLSCYLAKSLMMRVEQTSIAEPGAFDRALISELRPYLRHFGVGTSFFVDALLYKIRGYNELADHSFSQGVVKLGRLVWAGRRMLRLDFQNRLKEFDDLGYSLAPGVPPNPQPIKDVSIGRSSAKPQVWFSYLDERKSAPWGIEVLVGRPAVCTVLVPTLNPTEIFAGIATALDLGVGLAKLGHRVRFVSTDLPMVCPHASKAFISQRIDEDDRDATLSRIELACGVTAQTLQFSPFDSVIATAWWTAHIAKSIISHPAIGAAKFYYLIQDFEPNFYAWGNDYAGAMESYFMPCIPIFNTTLLRDYFFEQGINFGAVPSLAFRPSIDINRYATLERVQGRKKRRIAMYGRPEVPRNMFPVCIEALAELVHSQNLTPDTVEIVSVGLAHEPILLPRDMVIQSLGKLPIEDYPVFLTTVDIGLSLMYSPHPSHPPIEMAASGARVVTNSFGPKNLSHLSPLILSAEPKPTSVAKALVTAWKSIDDPISQRARQIDLAPLGKDLDQVVAEIFDTLTVNNSKRRVA